MAKKAKIWLFILLTPIVLIYLVSPPRNLTIEISASPQGVQNFYIEVTSSRPNLHGRTYKSIFKGLVPINQKARISLDTNKTLWGGDIGVSIYHPEYYREVASASNKYILPSATFSPTTWIKILSSEEKLVSQQVYRPDVISYRDVPMSHFNNHLSSANEIIIDLYLKNNSKIEIQKSFDVLISNTEQYLNGMLEENMGEYGETKEMKDEIEKTYNLTNEIYEKIN